jgi:hypothetical protein
MSRRADIVNALKENPIALAPRLGFDLLTSLHSDWCREMVFGTKDHTLQAHRGSYKTTTVSIALWELMLLRPNAQMAFFRKTDTDVKEILEQVKKMLRTDATQYLSEGLWGVSCHITTDNMLEVSTSLSSDARGGAQLTGMGIGGSLTGKHYDLIFTDDIVNLKDRSSRAERERTKNAYREIKNLVNRGGKIFNTGTPWHIDDAFKLMPEPDRYPWDSTGLMTREQYDEIAKVTTPSLLAANYELRHIPSDDVIFTSPKTGGALEMVYHGECHVDAAYYGEDYTAFSAMAVHDGIRYVYGRIWRKHVDECMPQIMEDYRRLMLGRLYTERNADKGYSARRLKQLGARVVPYDEHENKHIKIVTYLKEAWPNIVFVDGTDEEYINQIVDYTEDAEHDDAPDSAASLCRVVKGNKRRQENARTLY